MDRLDFLFFIVILKNQNSQKNFKNEADASLLNGAMKYML